MSVKGIEYIADQEKQTEPDETSLRIKIINDTDSFKAVSGEWNALVEEADSHIYQTFEWQYTWWKYFCKKNDSRELYIILLYDENQLTGIAPFFIDHFKFNHKTIYKCLSLIGSKVMQDDAENAVGQMAYTDSLDLIIRPGFEKPVISALWYHLKEAAGIDDIVMDEVPEYSSLFRYFVPLLKNRDQDWYLTVKDSSIYQIINLPDSWENFLQELSHNARKKIRKCLKMADESYGNKVFDSKKVYDREEVEKAFRWLVKTHQQRWNKRGRPGVFADRRLYDFYKSMTMSLNKQGKAEFQVVSVPSVGDRPIAMDLIFRYKKIIYAVNTGFDSSSEFARYSPGHISLYSIIKEAIEEGNESVTFARGIENYKFRASNRIVKNKKIILHKITGPGTYLFLIYRVLNRLAFFNRRMRYEWTIIYIYFKEYNIPQAAGYYLLDLYYRVTLKFKDEEENI